MSTVYLFSNEALTIEKYQDADKNTKYRLTVEDGSKRHTIVTYALEDKAQLISMLEDAKTAVENS